MTTPYRVLVTGSRDWADADPIRHALTTAWLRHTGTFIVVHGACPTGADWIASDWVTNLHEGELGANVTEEPHPADWRPGGKFDRAAGFRRNADMVALGANLCLAFIRNSSRGATHTANLADRAGIPVRLWTA
ncbi:SLOG family protein [Streptomyces phytophilus]|uniref:SLOG family protein n=1 Tax=Streptomyces phytophilus TaxID=722715 RepID=UPI0015F12423|nr:SLOG family protein [Streptomyces phytophilus]